uniref:DUF1640 domain-containing protein n=1 Tax=Candidatus Kentrum sp. UNK TaxID=2126344 RepID=A0A451AW44_9GAMM|nr:MAG: hypothetical protein BECKUNK1418G_GA0071005_10793 [Candidatus Kentron sp. UNK]VFK70266.1 MAG: hypothetical protein BECKUNK1418H_GA0071006_102535 [Candidatus Kentron sp. UNK]
MFDNDVFEKWLDTKSQEIVEKMGRGEPLLTEEMMVLVLKAQSNHFHHLDKDLRNETKTLRMDMRGEMKTLREDMQNEMKTLREDMQNEMKTLREDMDKRFEQVMRRIDRFMFWSLGVTVAAAAFVVTYLK